MNGYKIVLLKAIFMLYRLPECERVCSGICTKEGHSLQYLYYILKVFNFEPYKTGMAIPHIYFKDYGKAKIFCPPYQEQLRYAKMLSAIDDKLLAEQNILTNLSLLKQYLLRQMFI